MHRNLSILMAVLFVAFLAFAVTGCDEEDLAEAAGADTDFEEDEEIELQAIEYTDGKGMQAFGVECGQTTVNAELERIGVDPSDVDVDNVELRFVEARYKNASWTPADITQLTCSVTFGSEEQGMATVWETAINGASVAWTPITVNAQAESVINYYLSHRNETFSYCAQCDDDPDTAYVEFYLNLGVTVEGEVNLD